MAGQLGLDPPTMELCAGGLVAELVQALENSEAIANCFNSSLASAILIVVYCSAYLQSSERYKIQQMITDFLKQKVSEMQTACICSAFDPIFLYVLAPDLPKGYIFLLSSCITLKCPPLSKKKKK